MADNTTLSVGAGGDTIRAIDKGGKKAQVVILDIGGAGAEAFLAQPLTDTQLRATAVPISAAALPLPAGAATSANQATEIGALASIDATATLIRAKTDNLDVLLSTRLKAADTLAAVTNLVQMNGTAIAMNTGVRAAGVQRVTIATDDLVPVSAAALPLPAGASTEATLALIKAKTDNLDVVLSTRLKAADTLTGVTTVAAVTAITNALPAGANLLGKVGLDQTTPGTTNGVVVNAGDVDHDAVNTLKNIQMAGHASPADVPPAVVSANGDRARIWVDRSGAQIIRPRRIRESYTAVFRLAEAAARLDQTFTHVANTNKQWATLHHTAAATKEVRLLSCVAWITSAITVAPQGVIELRQISAAPATGNPAITPTAHRRGGTAAEAVALYLPTTAGTEAAVNSPLSHHVFDEAVTVATVALAHPQGYGRGGIVLYDAALEDPEILPPSLPVGVLDGWAVVTRLTGATVMRMTVVMKFTEEIP